MERKNSLKLRVDVVDPEEQKNKAAEELQTLQEEQRFMDSIPQIWEWEEEILVWEEEILVWQ